jgi:phosphate transport system protein
MTPQSTRYIFDNQLQKLVEQMLVLGNMVEQAIQQSVFALQRHDLNTAQRIYGEDQRINEKRYALENECIRLIATQQPMARDIRTLSAILEIITELERIGDYAKGISKIIILIKDDFLDLSLVSDFQHMSELGLDMLRRALDAFVRGDISLARSIPADDDEVDQLYNRIYLELTHRMINDTATIDNANHMMWVAHNLERMADRVINICERIVYVSTGEMKELDAKDGIDQLVERSKNNLSNQNSIRNLPRILFLCTHNSARSQMAEAFLRRYAGDRFEVYSAGIEPGQISPFTKLVMEEKGYDLAGHRSKGLIEYMGKVHFAYLITVCDRAEQQCPIFPGMGMRLHWSIEDPNAETGNDERKLDKFRKIRDEIDVRIRTWIDNERTEP